MICIKPCQSCALEKRPDTYQNALVSTKCTWILPCIDLLFFDTTYCGTVKLTQLFLRRLYGLNCAPQSVYAKVPTWLRLGLETELLGKNED